MAKVKAADIKDRESLEAWLNTWPEQGRREVAVVIAHRCAMRALYTISANGLNQHNLQSLLLLTFRLNVIVRVAITWPTFEIAKAAASASVAVMVDKVTTAATTIALVVANAIYATDSHTPTATFATALASASSWGNIQTDILELENGTSVVELLATPLWLETPDWFETERDNLKRSTQLNQWSIWFEWYDRIAAGKSPFLIVPAKASEKLERRIALGDNREDFWDREPAVVNAEIKKWVDEARVVQVQHESITSIESALAKGQGNGFRFSFDKLIKLLGSKEFSDPKTDILRVNAQLPILQKLVSELEKRVGAGSDESDLLLLAIRNLQSELSGDLANISPEALFAHNLFLRSQVAIRKTSVKSLTSNYYELADGDLALAQTITLTSDLILQATERGKKLFADADLAFRDAGAFQGFEAWEKKIVAIVESAGGLMDDETLALLKLLLSIGKETDHPNRLAYFKSETIGNLVLVLGGVAIGGSTLILVAPHLWPVLMVAIAVDKLVGGGIAKTDLAKVTKNAIGNQSNKIIDKIFLENKEMWLAIAKSNSRFKWVEDLIALLESEKQKRKDN